MVKKYNELHSKRVVVTGAGGFIGSHLSEELVKRGANVKCLIHYNALNYWGNLEKVDKDILNEIEVIPGDILDFNFIYKTLKDVYVVLHLAALISIPFSYNAPSLFTKVNIEGTINILQAALERNIDKVVVTSTSEVYGTAVYTPINEEHPLQAQSPYSASKIGAETVAYSYFCSYNLPVSVIRPFNTYGPRQSARAIIPTIITQAINDNKIKLGLLTPVRDMNFVLDIVDGFIKIAENEKSAGKIINVGSGVGFTVGEIVEKIVALLGKNIKVIEEKGRIRPEKSEVMKLICDNTKAGEILNWKQKYSLEEGLKITIDYLKENLDQYKKELYNI